MALAKSCPRCYARTTNQQLYGFCSETCLNSAVNTLISKLTLEQIIALARTISERVSEAAHAATA